MIKLSKAFEQARLLGNSWVGPEHLLLTVLTEPSPATEALAELGVSHDRLTEDLSSRRHEPPAPPLDPNSAPSLNAAAYNVIGWAEGYAAALGLGQPQTAHLLLATVYLDTSMAPHLHSLGVSANAVVDALARRGVRVPSVAPPTYKPWRGPRIVEIAEAELGHVIELLHERHPEGSEWRWGFNTNRKKPGRAIVVVEEGIDIDAIIAEARRRQSQ